MKIKFFNKVSSYIKRDKEVILLIILTKIVVISLVLTVPHLLPFNNEAHNLNFTYPDNEIINALTSFKTWDGQHYIFLAEKGYGSGESNRFSPLYPILIGLLHRMLVPSIVGGVFISVVASGLALFLLYKLVLLQFKDKSLAFNAVLVGICFPTSFYFSLVYSEALFLFLLVSLFYLVKQKKMMLSLIPAILLPLSRPVGIFVIIPLLFSITLLKGKNFSFKIPTFNKPLRFSFNPKYFYAFAPAVGLVLYFIFIKSATGDLTSGIDQLNAFPNWDILNILNPFGMIKNFFSVGSSLHAFHESYIDRAFFIGFILILPIIYKKMGKDYFFLTLLFGMVPLFGSFISYTRYLLPLFPVWIAIAFLFNNRPALKYSVLYLFLLVQAIFLTMHVLNYWVA